MSDFPKAKVRGGGQYTGNQQFAGGGLRKSCGKCGQHRMVGGGAVRKPWGWVCSDCKGGKA